MSDTTTHLGLPYLMAAQAQKHVTHNEALRLLDAMVQLAVLDRTRTAPPASPADGDRHLVASGATGLWAGWDLNVAFWVDGAWVRLVPRPGWLVWVADEALLLVHDAAGWAATTPDTLQNLTQLGIATTADTTNRLAVSSAATLLSHEGAGHQLKINKAASTDTASVLFQTGWSSRAEMGTAGGDGFAIKVSQDGDTWHTGLAIDPASGQAQLPNGAEISGAITGSGAGNLPGLRSHASDTGVVTTGHDRLVLASLNSRASGQRAVVLSSDGAVASGASAMALASDNSALTGTRAFAASSLSGAIGGFDGALISTLESEADGFRTAVVASFNAQVNAGDAMVVCSRRVLNTVTRSLALGDAGSGGALSANRTIHMLSASGNIQIAGSLSSSHNFSDFAEMFANATGAEIPPGTIVTETGGAVRPAGAGDEIAGVVTATAVVTAGDTPFAWQGRYLSDEWGRPLYDTVPDPDHGADGPAPLIEVRRQNPAWNPDEPQVPRSKRPDQWTCVGLLGQVFTRVAADVVPGDRLAALGGIGVKTTERTGLRCMTITQPFDATKGYAIARCLLSVRV